MGLHRLQIRGTLGQRVLGLLLSPDDFLEKSGDIEEVRTALREERGTVPAGLWMGWQMIKLIFMSAMVNTYWRVMMWRNYLKSVWRNLSRNKTYATLNILGLALGMSCALALFLVVHEELTYDHYHEDSHRVYRISETIETATATRHYAPIAWPMGPAVKEKCPQVEAVVRVYRSQSNLIKKDDKAFYEDAVFFAEKDLFKVLSFTFIQGDAVTALEAPNSMVITRSMARKYFGHEQVLGETLRRNETDYTVTGLVADAPRNTHLKYHLIASLKTIEDERWMSNWWGTEVYTYLKVKPHVDVAGLQQQMVRLGDEYVGGSWASGKNLVLFELQPITNIHLHSKLRYEIEAPGNLTMVRLLMGIGGLVLLVSCMNYINLASARSVTRAREVGLRKVVGAHRGELIRQFFGDALFMSVLTMGVSLGMLALGMPLFNHLAGTAFGLADLFRPMTLTAAAVIVGICGVGAGVYPAILLSAYPPSGILKGTATRGKSGRSVRKVMVIFQFVISILLAVSTLIIFDQIHYMKQQYPGFDKAQKWVLPVRGGTNSRENLSEVKDALLGHPGIQRITASSSVPGRQMGNYAISIVDEADEKNQGMYHLYFDEDFIPAYQIELLAGRNYEAGLQTDVSDWDRRSSGGFLVNQAAMKAFGVTTPLEMLGKRLKTGAGARIGPVLGVVADFHFKGLQSAVEPLVMEYFTPNLDMLTLELQTQDLHGVMAHAEQVWNHFYPEIPMDAFFLDADFDRLYRAEEALARVAGAFTVMGLIVACLGLLGLSAFTAAQRTREIGIRKALGASVGGLLVLLSKDYMRWIGIANLLAWPLVWLLMRRWLAAFAARVPVTPLPFVLAGAGTLIVAVLSVSVQSYRAAVVNPVKSLKHP